MKDAYALVIIGGGVAELIASAFEAQFGAPVAFIEKGRIGG